MNTQKEHQDRIAEDQQDLKKLQQQIQKVQRIRKEYFQQKQEIGSLKNVILELKNQNEQLKSRQYLNDNSENNFKNRQNSFSDDQICKKDSNKNGKSQTWKSQKNQNLQQTNDLQYNTCPKIWGSQIQKNPNTHRNLDKKIKPIRKQSFKQFERNLVDYPPASIRNHSGYISTGRLLSPQPRNPKLSQTYLRNLHQQFNPVQQPYHYQSTHQSTKTKLLDSLLSDLKHQLHHTQSQLSQQKFTHKATRSRLKTTLTQANTLTELNHKLSAQYELIAKQNQYLKQELMQCTEARRRVEADRDDVGFWVNMVMNRTKEEFQIQFMAMDGIYWEFQRICGGARGTGGGSGWGNEWRNRGSQLSGYGSR